MKDVQLLSRAGAVTAIPAFRAAPAQGGQALSKFEAQQVVRQLHSSGHRSALVALHALVTGFESHRPSRLRDSALVSEIESSVASGRIVFMKGWAFDEGSRRRDKKDKKDEKGAANAASLLAQAIMGDSDALVFEGRRYRLTASAGVSRQNVQDGYRLVGLIEAPNLLKRMAEQIPTTDDEREQWEEVVALATKSGPREGLTVLRHVPSATSAPSPTSAPALTPSQLRPDIATDDWIEIEVLYEDGTAFAGNCDVELPDGRITKGPPGEGGVVRMDGITSGSCQVKFPDLEAGTFQVS